MKKRQDNCTRASAVQIILSIALISISAVLLAATSFKRTPLASELSAAIAPGFEVAKDNLSMAGPTLGSTRSVVGAPFTFDNTGSLGTARKTQGAAGTLDINIPSSGLGVESRSPGANGSHVLVLTFDATAVSGKASVTAGVGMVQGQPIFNGNQMTINLTGVTNAQRITVKLSNLNSSGDDVSVSMGVLLGDTNGNGSVNATDVNQTKLKSGQAFDATNFSNDVNANGSINASDVSIAKLNSGTALP